MIEREGNPNPHSGASAADPAHPAVAGAHAAPARPPLLRDPWAWLTALAVLPLLWFTRGTPRGEAVAEDFDFLRRAVLEGGGSWFDGGGSLAYWRPLANQAYFQAFGELLLEHPGRVALFHTTLLALASVLVYRALRESWPGSQAAAAASFPLFAEPVRSLACWASNIADLGAMVFLAVAIHERSRRRLATGLAAAGAALLCKEFAVIGVLLLPFLPDASADRSRTRMRWLVGGAAVAAAWAAAYLWVRASAGMELPHGLESDPALVRTSFVTRLAWAFGSSLSASFSLGRGFGSAILPLAAAAFVAVAALALARHSRAAARWREVRGWAAWGAAFALGTWLALAPIYPLWSPYRSVPGSVGFGIGAVALAGAVHPALPAGIAGVRLALFAMAPGTPARIDPVPENHGAFFDYPKLSRLQQLMAASRRALTRRHPTLPRGATVAFQDLPLSTEYAFGGPLAVQSWYRDTTLRWVPLSALHANPELQVVAVLAYQIGHDPQVVVIEPDAARWKAAGVEHVRQGRWNEALATLARADSCQTDRAARVFLGDVAGRRSYALAQLGRWDEAHREAREALRAASEDVGARLVVAAVHALRREDRAAHAQLDTLLAMAPGHEEGLALRETLRNRVAAKR